MGLDIGDRRIGVALSDPGGILASPQAIIDRRDDKTALEAISKIISQHPVDRIIVGLPRSLNGSLGRQAEEVKTFIQKISDYTTVPVEFRDERLTSVAAKRLLRAASPKRGRKVRDDAVAAALILQGYLDEIRND